MTIPVQQYDYTALTAFCSSSMTCIALSTLAKTIKLEQVLNFSACGINRTGWKIWRERRKTKDEEGGGIRGKR